MKLKESKIIRNTGFNNINKKPDFHSRDVTIYINIYVLSKNKKFRLPGNIFYMVGKGGIEPPRPFGSTDFKLGAVLFTS
ncbi:MAG TPA: hypothetical protein DDZ91_03485 [Firmicutes bacterium]|nr:hypothetical protein [Bacillota bacterium]